MRQLAPVESRPLVANRDLQAVVVHPIGDVDQAVGLVEVAPLDGVMGHFHDRLPKLHHLLMLQGSRLADQHEEVVQVLEEVDLAVELDVDLALDGALLACCHARPGRR